MRDDRAPTGSGECESLPRLHADRLLRPDQAGFFEFAEYEVHRGEADLCPFAHTAPLDLLIDLIAVARHLGHEPEHQQLGVGGLSSARVSGAHILVIE